MPDLEPHERILFALDVDTTEEAACWMDRLRGFVGGVKIGSRLYTREGPAVVRLARERGWNCFLDLKFHDIPETAAGAVAAATDLGVWMCNLHALGGMEMMGKAAAAARGRAEERKMHRPLLLAVTVLTSMDRGSLRRIGLDRDETELAVHLATMAMIAGLDGVVASPLEVGPIRRACGGHFLIVTPGIRAAGSERDDQKRTATAAEAIGRGSDYVVVGRPIRDAADPVEAARNLARQVVDGLEARD